MSASQSYTRALRVQMDYQPGWATGGVRHAGIVRELIYLHSIKSVLDFGCGRGTLGNAVMCRDTKAKPPAIEWRDYDPAIEGKHHADYFKQPVDMIVSTHSLEHIEPDELPRTWAEWRAMSPRLIYAAIPSGPATKTFAGTDRDLHLIQRPPDWWCDQLAQFGFITILEPSYTKAGKLRDETRFVVVK